MLEVVFNESASISLMMAQRYGKGPFPEDHGIPAVMFYGEQKPSEEELEKMRVDWLAKEREKWEKAVPLGGKGTDIFCFDLVLNIGGIGDDFVEERKRVLHRFDYTEIDVAGRRIKETLDRMEAFCQRVEDGEPVRIWFGRGVEDMCGMLWLCHEIVSRGLACDEIYAVKLPEEKLSSDEVRDEEFCQFAQLQTLMEREEIQFYASQWEALKAANAPLRVAVRDCVLSATEDYYDVLIWKEIEKMDGEFQQTKLIGRLLDKGMDIRDSWLTYRLNRFVEQDKLELVAVDHECSWIRILRRKEQGDA